MSRRPTPVPRPAQTLPERASLEHLRNQAKQRLKALRVENPAAKLSDAQLAVAREYGFASWRRLKAHLDAVAVFAAAARGDVDTVRRAFDGGFDPATPGRDGRTVHQIGKQDGNEAIELLAREYQERDARRPAEEKIVNAILAAAGNGEVDALRRLLDAHPALLNARGSDFQKQTALHCAARHNRADCVRLLLHRGADVNLRDIGDNATALHFAAHVADLAVVRDLVEAGADVVGAGDDHQLGVLGWATCFRETRTEIANYLLDRGAPLDIWSAIALEGAADVRRLVAADPGLLVARMSRNEHRRTPLHHAAAKNRPATVRLLLELGADALATDAAGATPLTAAAQANADPAILGMLQAAGATLDLTAALSMGRFDLAEAMLRDDPTRIGMEGRDTIALHLAVARRDMPALRWLIGHGVAVNAKRVLWDCNGTALHMTAEHGLAEIARLLLQAGADPTICDDKYNATVPEWAEYCGQPDVARVLKEAPRSG